MTPHPDRADILDAVRAYVNARPAPTFTPGSTPVPYAGRVYDAEELVSLVDASLDFWLTAGRYAEQFEKELATFLDIPYCLLVNSGSSANLLAIAALTSPLLGERRLVPGDEVITTACGFPTTVNPIILNGLVPVFVDVAPETYNTTPDLVEAAIGPRTRAIILAHTLGNPFDARRMRELADRHSLWLIEDNCDALGSTLGGTYTGTFGDLATLSFYPAHHITMGEGGAVLTATAQLRRIVRSLRDWGRDCWCEPGHDATCGKRFSQQFGALPHGYDHKYVYSHIGYNLKVTDMQAAIGCAQLAKLPDFIRARRRNFEVLHKALERYTQWLVLPRACDDASPSWFGFPLLVREGAPFTRAAIVAFLERRRIATRMLFGGNLTKQPAYSTTTYRIAGSLDMTDRILADLFWIGVYPGLTDAHLEFCIAAFDDFMREVR